MSKAPFRRIQPFQAQDLLARPDIQVIDVRDRASFDNGRIGAAQHAGMPEVERMVFSVAKDKPVLVYCYHGNASQTYAQMFADFGFKEVYSLDGGYEGWQLATRRQSRQSVADLHDPGRAGTPSRHNPLEAQPQRQSRQSVADLHDSGRAGTLSRHNPLEAQPQCRQGVADLRDWLAEQGFPPSDVNATIANRTTPLMQAARLGELAIAAQLVAAGADLDARNGDGNNALWLACFHGSLEMMDVLIGKDIALNNQNDNGATCLMYAASAGKTPVVARLLEAGADAGLQSLDDYTALDMAANLECLSLLRKAAKGGKE